MARVEVHNLANVQRALRQADKDVRLGINKELRKVGEPVKQDAQALALGEISNLGLSWSQMRLGVKTGSLFMVPKQRGARRSKNKRRPNLAPLLFKPMTEALERNEAQIEREFNAMLFRVAADFNR